MINEKAFTSKKERFVIVWCMLVLFVPALCGAEESNRSGKGELFGIFQYMGGEIEMDLILEGPTGEELWRESVRGGSSMVQFSYAKVDLLVKKSATQICNKIIKAVTTESFVQAFDEF